MTSTLPADSVRGAINYFYLVAFCPPANVSELKKVSRPMRTNLASVAGIPMAEYTKYAVPEVSRRIISFHESTRRPAAKLLRSLAARMRRADSSAENALAFQQKMAEVSQLPGRADANRRLHRKKGCSLCVAPCRYGFFTLVSDPAFKALRIMLESESTKSPADRNAVNLLWTFTAGHLWRVLGARRAFISVDHLANLSFCLLLLATARSRLALPEAQLQAYQTANQAMIRQWRPAEIKLVRSS